MIIKKSIRDIKPFVTLDNSLIYEYIGSSDPLTRELSVALAVVEKGKQTRLHIHVNFDEIYFVVSGAGEFISNKEKFKITEGDIIYIPKNTAHCVYASEKDLKILCICFPPYTHEGTKIIGEVT